MTFHWIETGDHGFKPLKASGLTAADGARRRRAEVGRRASFTSLDPSRRVTRLAAVRVDRWFAFVDLSGFTSFGDEFGDDESVRVLTLFRGAVRQVATDFGVRIAKWLGDGCMFVSVEPAQLVAAVCELEQLTHELELPLAMHAGMAGGAVILLEGDDYTGRSREPRGAARDRRPAARDPRARSSSRRTRPTARRSSRAGMITVAGLHDPVEVVRFGSRPSEHATFLTVAPGRADAQLPFP